MPRFPESISTHAASAVLISAPASALRRKQRGGAAFGPPRRTSGCLLPCVQDGNRQARRADGSTPRALEDGAMRHAHSRLDYFLLCPHVCRFARRDFKPNLKASFSESHAELVGARKRLKLRYVKELLSNKY